MLASLQRVSARCISLRVDERLRTTRSVIAACSFSFWAGAPALGAKLSSIARLGPAILTAPTSSKGGANGQFKGRSRQREQRLGHRIGWQQHQRQQRDAQPSRIVMLLKGCLAHLACRQQDWIHLVAVHLRPKLVPNFVFYFRILPGPSGAFRVVEASFRKHDPKALW
jgi:hypothetical protein